MKLIVCVVLISNCFFTSYCFSMNGQSILAPKKSTDKDTTVVKLNSVGDTLFIQTFIDSIPLEEKLYYNRNRLRMVLKYREGNLFNIERSLDIKGNPVYPGSFYKGTGSIIEYSENGQIYKIEYWNNYEISYIEYFNFKRRIKRVFYNNNIPAWSIITKIGGRVLSKTTYEVDGLSIKYTEYFDENMNVQYTLYGH